MEGNKLRILMVNNTDQENPSYFVRNKVVAEALNARGHSVFCETQSYNEINPDDYDIFVFNRFYEGSLAKEITALRQMGKIIVYETDDDYFAMDGNVPFEKMKKHAEGSSRELIGLAHAITVSTPRLKERIEFAAKGSKPVFVIPNSLDLNIYYERPRIGDQLRIGWQGSNVHCGDLLMVIEPIKKLQKKYGFQFVIFGIDDRPLEELYDFCKNYEDKKPWMLDFIRLFDILQTMDYKFVPFTKTYRDYLYKIANLDLDIGICPLRDSAFNMAKSCLKFYEYAAVGTAALASKVVPYTTEMYDKDLVENDPKEWEKALEKLIKSKKLRLGRERAQSSWLRGHRNIEKVVSWWETTYNFLINNVKR